MKTDGFVYVVACGNRVKIGFSIDPVNRLVKMQSDSPSLCVLLGEVRSTFRQELELHKILKPYKVSGEWYPRGVAAIEYLIGCLKPSRERRTAIALTKRPLRHPIHAYRRARGMTLSDFGAEIGVHKACVSKWERFGLPSERIIQIESLTGIPRAKLRPDLFETETHQ